MTRRDLVMASAKAAGGAAIASLVPAASKARTGDEMNGGETLERSGTGDRFDSPNPGRDTCLRCDAEQPDLARVTDVSSSTELHGDTGYVDHPYLVSVLLTEEGHGTLFHGVGMSHDIRVHGMVLPDPAIHLSLDSGKLFVRDGSVMGKIKTQAIGSYQRPPLNHVVPKVAPESGVEEMGGCVVSFRVVTDGNRDLGLH